MFVLVGAAAGTVAATVGVVTLVVDGDGEAVRDRATVRPAMSTGSGRIVEIGDVLRRHGATGCTSEPRRVECRYSDRYVAAEVVDPTLGVRLRDLLPTWKTGSAQAMTGDRGPFAILHGENWLVTGPDAFVEKVRPALRGRIVYCDRPYSTCK
ncbi:hypothetical protein DFJ69_1846 [Thermomonospora umbrina]|uniref:Uncharacterized protein n=1 Tax=Thermomonospora umbrina TaxID=111806 RepID=A0A3D9SR46_9ACTN|nr:hypothetical protein DFJ69_1846 [Thermomonospora umbrina]